MAGEPVVQTYIDFGADGTFSVGDEVTSAVKTDEGLAWSYGRSADYGFDAQGQSTFTLNNKTGAFTGLVQVGLPVLVKSTFSGTTTAQFFGYVQRSTPDYASGTILVTVYDQLRRYADVDCVVPSSLFVTRSGRDCRVAILEDFERGILNFLPNPSFETNINQWVGTGTTRITTDHSNVAGATGTASMQWVAPGAGSVYAITYLTPYVLAGQVYRFRIDLKASVGSPNVTVSFINTLTLASYGAQTFAATNAWATYTTAVAAPSTFQAQGQGVLGGAGAWAAQVSVDSACTLLLDCAMVTRGQATYPYADVGVGRWVNYVANGGFDGGALNGWYDAWTNLCTNGGFEAGITGWTGITQNATQHFYGANSGHIGAAATAKFPFVGTFALGATYGIGMWVFQSNGASMLNVPFILGSIGTPADGVTHTVATIPINTWTYVTWQWSPSANRTDAQFALTPGNVVFIDGVTCVRMDPAMSAVPNWSDSGPGSGAGTFTTSRAINNTHPKWGVLSQNVVTPATSGSGRVYDFNHSGAYFVTGKQCVVSVWLYATTAMPYKIGVAHNKGDGTWEDTSTTGTLVANTQTQVTFTVTPTVSYGDPIVPGAFAELFSTSLDTVLYVIQTNATTRTFWIDGVRVMPGSVADNYEQPYWTLPSTGEATDQYTTSASFSGSALDCLNQLNKLTMTRHWVEPTLVAPYYQYQTEDRVAATTKVNQDTLTSSFSGFTNTDVDKDLVVNVLAVGYAGGTVYFSDQGSVTAYGESDGPSISGGSFFPDTTIPASLASAMFARYKDPKARPTLVLPGGTTAQYLTQVNRNVNDLITLILVSIYGTIFTAKKFVIVKVDQKVSLASGKWTTSYGLEEYPF